ncbi:stage II sporulation protein M [Paenibacillus cellulosilyticus]|uniref:Stage II sporulation protein M n=1 Tax=Paenibacillus cellulosilyticus TaxID=375489 RepID=A0A2V2Z0A5_9BACL|nr:stage II sporulation protein M [Paenibacillus cellulosilyticus]PWW05628.1 stage II sporulation protein M [Paenibacillus cellulosilyticus]QKS45343.1 stage II sporulation protein M [Paenibacillus cellulosilyticus]
MNSTIFKRRAADSLTLYVFIGVLFAVGVVFGALAVHALTLEQQQNLSGDLDRFIRMMEAGMFPDEAETFWDRFFFYGKWIGLIGVLGMTVVGLPLVLALDFLKGSLVGFAIGTVVSEHGWKGIVFSLASVVPPNMIVVPAIVIASAAAISFALHVIRYRLLQSKGRLLPAFVSLCTMLGFMLLAVTAAALVEAYVSPALMRWAAPMLG